MFAVVELVEFHLAVGIAMSRTGQIHGRRRRPKCTDRIKCKHGSIVFELELPRLMGAYAWTRKLPVCLSGVIHTVNIYSYES